MDKLARRAKRFWDRHLAVRYIPLAESEEETDWPHEVEDAIRWLRTTGPAFADDKQWGAYLNRLWVRIKARAA